MESRNPKAMKSINDSTMLWGRSLVVAIDETGDRKKGKTTDYADRQYSCGVAFAKRGLTKVWY